MTSRPSIFDVNRNPLSDFDPDAVCPKCAYLVVTTVYQARGCTDESCTTCCAECLVRTCQRCRYQWYEQALTVTTTTNNNQGEHTMNNDITPNGDPTDMPWRIVIAQRGWVFVGRWDQHDETVILHDAKVVRVWGTTRGLGELALHGKTDQTVLDPAGIVRLHILGVVATLDTAVTEW